MQASTTTQRTTGSPHAPRGDTRSVAGLVPPRFAGVRTAGIPAIVAVWISVVAIGLAALTVTALFVDHEQTQQHLQVTGAP